MPLIFSQKYQNIAKENFEILVQTALANGKILKNSENNP